MRPYTRRDFVLGAAALGAASLPPAVLGQGLSAQPISLIVPFAPGGNLDVVARTLSVPLSRQLKQTIVVENRTGAGGAIGTAVVARAEPDGHTLLVASTSQLSTLPHMLSTQYSLNSFQPVGMITRTSMIVVVRSDDKRFGDFADFLAVARQQSEAVNAGHAGAGTANHLAMVQLEDAANIKFNSIAYRGSSPALLGLLGGHVDVVFDQVTSSMPYLEAGTLRALAVLGPEHEPTLPKVPAMPQLDVKAFDATTYVGLIAPSQTPPTILATLAQALQEALKNEKLTSTLSQLGGIVYPAPGSEFEHLLQVEDGLARQLAKQGRL
ncbi:tripartite tricarboxylate transporter substrate binding protein [Bordetella sp. BOR01]|uniref:tripartite tricarboxylate transporter substrate binding protein n=1 Tax=Bordetella sp. BOR01 TaxID=2854779 RepID=UPI001C43F5F1|nr:tripartite tricarboxylate transporter substrate binding protein [Bordetella sp. BOR01]MBV7484816.1 tripartite tricarboxylate transporter substrate binding protein [Bordetella sp. BOR01]